MVVQSNIPAVNAHRNLGINNNALSKNLEKLSSGFKINRAGDDAAGLAISEKMRSQIRGLEMAEQNTENAISLIQTAEGGLNETHAILQRMRELTVQASNGTYTTEDREQLNREYQELKGEITRIADSTHYNGINLLDGNLTNGMYGKITADADGILSGINSSASTATTLTNYTIDNMSYTQAGAATAATTASATFDLSTFVTSGTFANAVSAGEKITMTIGGLTADYTLQNGDTMTDLANGLKSAFETANTTYEMEVNGTAVTIKAKNPGADAALTSSVTGFMLSSDGTAWIQGSDTNPGAATVTAGQAASSGTPPAFTADVNNTAVTFTYSANTGTFTGTDADGNVLTLSDAALRAATITAQTSVTYRLDQGNELTFQIGANGGTDQRVRLGVGNMNASSIGANTNGVLTAGRSVQDTKIDDLVPGSRVNDQIIETLDGAINMVSSQRASLGAMQNRLEHTLNSLGVSIENLSAAESTIRDTDMAKEMMKFTQNSILVQASQAMLAQANALPQGILSLLG